MTIILALLVALVGPLFVDWTAYRSAFENQASEILGRPVHVTGTADATLLPVPQLVFNGVTIGEDPANPLMTVDRFEVEVELFPLLSGTVQVTRMELDQPQVTVRVADDGTVDWVADGPTITVDPTKVAFDRVEIKNGSFRLEDGRRPRPVEITGINAAVGARSLLGPYRFDGGMTIDGEPVTARIATGTREADGRIVLKAAVTPASRPVEIALDGVASVTGQRPEWTGKGTIKRIIAEGETVTPWQVNADVDADPDRLRASQLEFRYGPEDRPFTISGAATVDLTGAPRFDAVLSSRQIDLDRTLGSGPDQPVAFDAALSAFATTLASLPRPPIGGRVGFDIPGLVAGGSLIEDVRIDLATAPEGWTVEMLDAKLPGSTAVSANGLLSLDPAPGFTGSLSLSSAQPATLAAWWAPQRSRLALEAFDLDADVEASSAGLKLNNATARLGKANLSGDLAFLPSGAKPASLGLTLAADRIDATQVSALAGLFAGGGGTAATDVSLRLSADSVVAGRTSADGVEVTASLVGGTLDVERFYLRNLAGARISAEGAVRDVSTTPDGSLQARVSAEKLDGLAALVAELAPGSAAARMLETAAPVLVPATLEATVTAARVGDGTNATVVLKGTAGGSNIDTSIGFSGRVDGWRTAALDVGLDLKGPNGVLLMRQLGFDVPAVDSAGLGSLRGTIHGVPAEKLDLSLDGALGDTELSLSGRAKLPAGADATASLDVRLASGDVGPILALSGDLFTGILDRTPADLTANAEVTGKSVHLSRLTGTVAEGPVSGTLSVDLAPEVPTIRGDLALGEARLDSLLDLALGEGTTAMPILAGRNPWPEAPFGPTALDAVDTDVAVSFERVDTGIVGLPLGGVTTAIRSSASGIAFDQVKADFAGGKLRGSLVVKRDLEGQATVSGTVALEDAAAEALAWRRDDRPVVTGRLSLDLEGNATGRTFQGLVSSLAGGGTIRLADGEIRSMTPQAFNAVIRAADGGQDLPDDRIRQVFTDNLDAADLPFDRVEGSFTIASGVVRAPSIVVSAANAGTKGSATLDLPHWTLESDWTLALAAADAATAGTTPPEVDILFRGPVDRPERRIDVTAFSSYLGIRAFEKETERVLVLQADILERELLSRSVLRAKEATDRRIRAEEEERRRAAAEEERRAAEAARRALEEGGGEAPPPDFDAPAPVPEPLDLSPPDQAPLPSDQPASLDPPPSAGFADEIGRLLQEDHPDTIVIRPRPLTDLPADSIEVIPLPPPATTENPTLPGVRTPPPPG